MDLMIWEKDKEVFLSLHKELQTLGYEIIEWWFGGYRVYYANGKSIPGDCKFPFLDVFFGRVDADNRLVFTSQRAMVSFPFFVDTTESSLAFRTSGVVHVLM